MSNTPTGPPLKANAEPIQHSENSLKRKRGLFQKDLKRMMYGFGDEYSPLPETLGLVEDIVVDCVTQIVHKAQDTASRRGRLLTEDLLFFIRKDLPKMNRCRELLSMDAEIKKARTVFRVDEEKLSSMDLLD